MSAPKGLHPLHPLRFPSLPLTFASLLLLPALGCNGQTPSPGAALTTQQSRNVQLEIRSQLGVPPNWVIAPGDRQASDMPGYDKLTVEFYPDGQPDKGQPIAFLISKDGKTLARLSTYDLTNIPGTHIDTAGRPVRGDKAARVELVNFDDLECPFCARLHAELFPDTLDHYKGLIKIVYKDDPLTEIHPWAMHAAVNANCLAAQSGTAYWNYVDYLHTHGDDITGPDRDVKKSYAMLDQLAKDEGGRDKLNTTTLDSCVAKQDETLVRAEMKTAADLKIEGTPALFVDGEQIDGAQPTPYIWAAIDRALRAKGITPPAGPAAPVAPTDASR
jgi:protein-disulfide isomerase